MEKVCQLKSEQETVKSQVTLYKYMLTSLRSHYFLKTSPFIHTARNPSIHHELCQQYKKLKENMELKTMDSHIESLERQVEEYQFEFKQARQRFWWTLFNPHQHRTTIENALTQRFSNITNRLTCIEKYKKRFLQIPHP
jgi:hypothetical protein